MEAIKQAFIDGYRRGFNNCVDLTDELDLGIGIEEFDPEKNEELLSMEYEQYLEHIKEIQKEAEELKATFEADMARKSKRLGELKVQKIRREFYEALNEFLEENGANVELPKGKKDEVCYFIYGIHS
jgi:vacuolar-type H+-ATPase subunit I/STV1